MFLMSEVCYSIHDSEAEAPHGHPRGLPIVEPAAAGVLSHTIYLGGTDKSIAQSCDVSMLAVTQHKH